VQILDFKKELQYIQYQFLILSPKFRDRQNKFYKRINVLQGDQKSLCT